MKVGVARCCWLILSIHEETANFLFFYFVNWRDRVYQSPSIYVLYWKLMFALEDFIKACPVGLTDSLSQRTLGIQMKGTVKLKSEKQQTTDSFNCFVLFFVLRMLCSACCSLFVFAYALLVSSVCCLLRLFHSGWFLLRVSFHMFSRACFVPYVLFCVFCTGYFLFQSGHPPPPSLPAVPMERCQPTPLSAARAPPALWDSRKVVWSGSRSLTVDRLLWVVTAARPYRWRHKPWRWVTMTSNSAVTWTGWKTSQEKAWEPALDVSD